MKFIGQYGHIIFMLLAAQFLVEPLSSNLPPTKFFHPANFLLLIVFYGFFLLLFADAWARWKLSFGGLLFLGFAYGIFNEGIIAKTFFTANGDPSYVDYGVMWGLTFPWITSILTVHAVLSMFFPALLARYIFPEQMTTPFLSNKTRAVLLFSALFLGGSAFFFGDGKFVPAPGYFLAFIGTMLLLILVARRLFSGAPDTQPQPSGSVPLASAVLGFICIVGFLFTTFSIASFKINIAIFLAANVFYVLGFIYFLRRKDWASGTPLVTFALGSYIGLTTIGAVYSFSQGTYDGVAWNIFWIIVLAYLIYRLKIGVRERVAGPL